MWYRVGCAGQPNKLHVYGLRIKRRKSSYKPTANGSQTGSLKRANLKPGVRPMALRPPVGYSQPAPTTPESTKHPGALSSNMASFRV